MKQFIFGADGLPKTPQELAKLRRIAEALAPQKAPQNVGEGLNALGNAIVYRAMMGKADKAESAGIDSANSAFANLFGPSIGTKPADVAPVAAPQEPVAGTMENARSIDRGSIDDYAAKPAANLSDIGQMEAYIRQAATQRGIDPDIAVKVAKSEGLAPGVWQSNVKKNGIREPSYGPFQLLVGDGKNFPKGMGNDFMAKTGLDPRDPSTVQKQIDFALDNAKTTGWRPWYGAKRVGLGAWDGINANQVASTDAIAAQPGMIATANKPVQSAMVNALQPIKQAVAPVEIASAGEAPAMPQKEDGRTGILKALVSGDFRTNKTPTAQPAEMPTKGTVAVDPRQQVAQAMQAGTADFDLMKAIEVMSDPYLPPAKKAVVQALIQRRMQEEQAQKELQLKQQDPVYQLDLETKRLGLDALKNPPKMKNLTDDEERAMGLDPAGVYQADQSGKISVVRDAPKAEAAWEYKDGVKFNKFTGDIEEVDGLTTPKVDFKEISNLRKEIQGLPSYKNLSQALPIYRSMYETAGRDTRASDLNLVYGLGKIMDPTSVVREGEMVMVKNTSSLPDWLQGTISSLNGGAALTPETRRAILKEAYGRISGYDQAFKTDAGQYSGIVERNRINPADVIPDFGPFSEWSPEQVDGAVAPTDGVPATGAMARVPAINAQPTQDGVPEGVDPGVWAVMTPEERALWPK